MVGNYDVITAEENARVSDTSYKNATAYLKITNYNTYETENKKETDSKKRIKCFVKIFGSIIKNIASFVSNKPSRSSFYVQPRRNPFSPTTVDSRQERVLSRSRLLICEKELQCLLNPWAERTINDTFRIHPWYWSRSSFISLNEIPQATRHKIRQLDNTPKIRNASGNPLSYCWYHRLFGSDRNEHGTRYIPCRQPTFNLHHTSVWLLRSTCANQKAPLGDRQGGRRINYACRLTSF